MKVPPKTVKKNALAIALFFALLYFLPISIPYKISFPLLTLAIAGIWVLPWQMTLAMTFSFLGDFMGAAGNFIGQMGFFALAHVFMISWFATKMKKINWQYFFGDAVVVLPVLITAYLLVVPHAPAGVIKIGVTCYATIISIMLYTGLITYHSTKKDKGMANSAWCIAIGAVLFVFSDYILAWNKFVSPIEYSKYLIMVPYYGAQFLLFLGASKYRK